MPRHSSRAFPHRRTAVPPALVARHPPMVALPWDASDSGNCLPTASAASRTDCSVAPASAISTFSSGHAPRIARIRSSEKSNGAGPSGMTCPPTRPVPPPHGTMPTRAEAQARTTAAASSTWRGAARRPACPRHRPRGSSRCRGSTGRSTPGGSNASSHSPAAFSRVSACFKYPAGVRGREAPGAHRASVRPRRSWRRLA